MSESKTLSSGEAFTNKIMEMSDIRELVQMADPKSRPLQDLAVNNLYELLNVFDDQHHSFGVLEVLSAILDKINSLDESALIQRIRHFIIVCEPAQIRLIPSKFSKVCQKFASAHFDLHQPIRAIEPLKIALLKLQAHERQLTVLHCVFLRACLLAKCYHKAKTLLDIFIIEIPDVGQTGFNVEHALLYYYYGGLIYLGLKLYTKSLQCFTTVISIPADAISIIMLEAYKKFILVSMIEGYTDCPKVANVTINRFAKSAEPYLELQKAFLARKAPRIIEIISKHAKLFEDDENSGLIVQAQNMYQRRVIKQMIEIYVTLPLESIAQKSGLAGGKKEAEDILIGMIKAGEIFATMNKETGAVSFYNDPEQYDNAESVANLQSRIKAVALLSDIIRKQDASLRTNSRFIKKTSGHGGGPESPFFVDTDLEEALQHSMEDM